MHNEQKTVGIGVQDFSKLREENLFYIDTIYYTEKEVLNKKFDFY